MPFPWFTSSTSTNDSRPPHLHSSSAAIISRSSSGRGGRHYPGISGAAGSTSLSTSLPSSRLDDVRAKTRTSYLRKELTQSHNIDLSGGRLNRSNTTRRVGSSAPPTTTVPVAAATSIGEFRRRGVIVAVEDDLSAHTPPASLSSSRHRIDQGLIDASRLSPKHILSGTMGGGEDTNIEKMVVPSLGNDTVGDNVPSSHKRWWSMMPNIMGSEGMSNATKDTAHESDAAAVNPSTNHRRSVSYNTKFHVP